MLTHRSAVTRADDSQSATTARIRLEDKGGYPRLRDYFLRLGAKAKLSSDDTLHVVFQPDVDLDLPDYLSSWVVQNRIGATLIVGHSVAPARVEVFPVAASPSGLPLRLGDLLLAKGMITSEQLAEALVESRSDGVPVGQVLLRQAYVFESELARVLAEQWNLPYLNIGVIGVDQAAMRLLPSELGMRFAAAPVRFTCSAVQVAFADPSDPQALRAVREHIPSIELGVAELTDISTAWRSNGRTH